MTTTTIELPTDIDTLVTSMALESASSGDPFRMYDTFKERLSELCGWDAPIERQAQYDLAIQRYIELARI